MQRPPVLVLYSRPGCVLCERLEDQLYEQFNGRFALDWRDVDRHADARAAYAQRIPVLTTAAGQEVCSGVYDGAAVARTLEQLKAEAGTV